MKGNESEEQINGSVKKKRKKWDNESVELKLIVEQSATVITEPLLNAGGKKGMEKIKN